MGNPSFEKSCPMTGRAMILKCGVDEGAIYRISPALLPCSAAFPFHFVYSDCYTCVAIYALGPTGW